MNLTSYQKIEGQPTSAARVLAERAGRLASGAHLLARRASRTIAGGGVRHERNHRNRPHSECAPEVAREVSHLPFRRPIRGGFVFGSVPVVPAPSSLHHRLSSGDASGAQKEFERPNNHRASTDEHLTMGHIRDKSKGGDDSAQNLRAVCTNCNEGLQNTALPKPDRVHLLGQIRRATIDDQHTVLEWLLSKFGMEATKKE